MNVKRYALALGLALALVLATLATHAAHAASAEPGYLSGQEPDFHTFLPGPPAVDSPWDQADESLVKAYQSVDDARFQSADLDQNGLYPRFADAFGHPIDKQTSPVLVALLNRAIVDAEATATVAKDRYHRPRPFQRMQLQHVCDKSPAPQPESIPMEGASYPSGHSARGWTVAMILARIAPDRSEALMARAQQYEESRLICGMHFPSDVEAGHEVAIAVVAHLDASKEFQADLAKARKEQIADRR